MSFSPESLPDPPLVPPDASRASGPLTVKQLKENLLARLPVARKLILATFASWAGATPCDQRWLVLVNARWESIRQRTVHGERRSNQLQATHHVIWETLGPLLGRVAAPVLAPLTWEMRLPRLRALLAFLLRPKERDLIDFLEGGPPEQAAQRVQERSRAVRELEARLDLMGILSAGLPAQGELDFALEVQEEDPGLAFGRAIVRRREELGLTQAEFARSVGLLPQNLYHIEKGQELPGPASMDLVARIVSGLNAPPVLAAYWTSRNFRNRQKPRCERNDVDLWAYVSAAHQAEFADFMVHENSRQHVPRRGRRDSGGRLAPNSRKGYYLFFRQVLATLQLPADEPDPRRRGLGLPATDVSFLDLTCVSFLHEHYRRQHLRCGRDSFARGDAMMLGKLIDLCSEDGYIYRHAERLAQTLPAASLARCPTHWPEGSECPGAPCQNAAAQIRAQCRVIRETVAPWRREATHAAPSSRHLRLLAPLLAQKRYPLEGLLEILHRPHRRFPRTRAEAFTMMILAILALQCWRPRRPEEFGRLRLEDLVLAGDGRTLALSHPGKNGHSLRARQQVFRALPPELAQPVRDYLDHARPLIFPGLKSAKDLVFCNRRGGELSSQTVGGLLKELVDQFAPDLFPMGLTPHVLRTIVATDLAVRFGEKVGTLLAADALIDHECTTLKSYILQLPNPVPEQEGEKTQEAAVAAAYRAVHGHKFRPTPLKA